MRHRSRAVRAALSFTFLLALCVCGGRRDAALVEHEVIADNLAGAEVRSDLGWTVRVDVLRAVVTDVVMTSGGETHASVLDPLSAALLGRAFAHPGHAAGGEILGELPGRFVVDFTSDAESVLGVATLIVGPYDGAGLTFSQAKTSDVSEEDPLLGHTFWMEGEASGPEGVVSFRVALDQDEGRRVDGAVFSHDAAEHDEGRLVLKLHLSEDAEGKTLFDGIDFTTLPSDGLIPADHDASIRLKRALQSHDFWSLELEGETT